MDPQELLDKLAEQLATHLETDHDNFSLTMSPHSTRPVYGKKLLENRTYALIVDTHEHWNLAKKDDVRERNSFWVGLHVPNTSPTPAGTILKVFSLNRIFQAAERYRRERVAFHRQSLRELRDLSQFIKQSRKELATAKES